MILLELLWAVPLGLLGWRAAVSGDPWRLRVVALGVIFAALLGAVLISSVPFGGDYSSAFGRFIQLASTAIALIGSVYLLYWGAITHDPPPHRLLSVVGGTVGLLPALLAIASALTHSATEPTR
jgi:hypothetical protein